MRVLMITFLIPFPEALNGAALVMHGQLAALSARHEVTLVTFAMENAAQEKALGQLRASGVKVHVVGDAWPTRVIRCKRFFERVLNRLRSRHPWSSATFIDPRMQRLLDNLLAQQYFDVVQAENVGFGNYRFETRIPSVLTEHEVGRSLRGDCEEWQQYQPAMWRQFERIQVFTPRDAAMVRAVAPELADRVRINPFGVDIPHEADYQQEEPGTVAFVGGFNHPPNVDAALWLGSEIMPLLRNQWPGIRLTIVGSSPPREVRALARDDIIVTGRVSAVEPYLERAAVVLAPLRTGGGMRVKVLQAMALGKTVVTTPLGAEGLWVPGCEPPLVIAEDAEGIARATSALLVEEQTRHTLGPRARAYVKTYYSWSAYSDRLERIYQELHPMTPSQR
jgi:glycosyltransferase involved in cell wall biosynthesis